MELVLDNIHWGIKQRQILNGISFKVKPGEIMGLLGPNGSGKSSLLRTIYRIHRPWRGRVSLNGQNVWSLTVKEVARLVAVLAQGNQGDRCSLTIRQMVELGRLPYKKFLGAWTKSDIEIIENSLKKTDLIHIQNRSFYNLSGGEQQRVLLARALCQQTQVLILDEPTNHLDIKYQLHLLKSVKELGFTTIMALHDPNLAIMFCDQVCLLKEGKIALLGAPEDVLTTNTMASVFEVKSELIKYDTNEKPRVIYKL